MTDRELLRLHVEACWALTLPPLGESSRDLVLTDSTDATADRPPWSLYLGAFANTEVAIWRAGIAPDQRRHLLERAHQAGAVWEPALEMRREVVFAAPGLTPPREEQARHVARVLTADDAERIEAFEAGSAAYFLNPHMAPCVGVVVDGQVVSIAHSSRQTTAACELGINTLPEARRQGYATAATTLWTALVQRRGLMPIYSAFAWNTASLNLAQVVGYTPRITGAYGPVPERDE